MHTYCYILLYTAISRYTFIYLFRQLYIYILLYIYIYTHEDLHVHGLYMRHNFTSTYMFSPLYVESFVYPVLFPHTSTRKQDTRNNLRLNFKNAISNSSELETYERSHLWPVRVTCLGCRFPASNLSFVRNRIQGLMLGNVP